MRMRLMASVAGGLVGILASFPIQAGLDLSPTLALVGCALAGVALGYVVSMLFHVFTTSSDDLE